MGYRCWLPFADVLHIAEFHQGQAFCCWGIANVNDCIWHNTWKLVNLSMQGADTVAIGGLVGRFVLRHLELAVERVLLPDLAVESLGRLQMALSRHLPQNARLSLLILYESMGGQIITLVSGQRDEFAWPI